MPTLTLPATVLSLLLVLPPFQSTAAGTAGVPIAETIAELDEALRAETALLRQGGSLNPVWLPNGRSFLFTENGADDLGVMLVEAVTGSIDVLASDQEVRAAVSKLGLVEGDLRLIGLTEDSTALLIDSNLGVLRYELRSKVASIDIALTRRAKLYKPRLISNQFPATFGPLMEVQSPDGKLFITIKDDNLYLRSAKSDNLHQLTSDGRPRETWLNTQESAQSFNVHWSPDSTRIATVQLDTREVQHEPLLRLLENPPRIDRVAYPRAGEPMHRFRLFIINIQTGARTAIETGDTEDHYVDLLGWQPDGKAVLLQIVDREHKRLRILSADASTGKTSVLIDDRADTYFDTKMTISFNPVRQLRSSNDILYLTEKSGWRHIERRNASGKLVATLTDGEWPVNDIISVDESSGYVYFRASTNPDAPYDLQLYRVPLGGNGQPKLLSAGVNRNDIAMEPGGRYFLAQRSGPHVPPVIELRSSSGELIRIISKFDDEGLQKSGFGGMESFVVRDLSDRWQMYGTIVKPYHFDARRKYPVVEIIYGGMQSFESRHQFYGFGRTGRIGTVGRMLLHSGFIVVFVDAPGTPGRGRLFQDATYRIWPQTVIDNHVHAIRQAAESRPWMDLERVGVYGHSWGAYMAQRAMIEAPTFFDAAVAHDGGSDFYDQPTYIEPFMGLPKSNPGGYQAASVLSRVDDFQGPVLVFSAPLDVNSGFSPAFKLVDAMVQARKDVELFVMPDSNHRLYCCSWNQELYKVAKIKQFFLRELLSARN